MNEADVVGGAEATAGGTYEKPTRTTSFSVSSSSDGTSLGPNLLVNPTCTVAGQGGGEEPLHWTVEQGEIECNEPEPDFMPDPRVGDYVFIDWEDLEPTTDESIVTQTVPVTGGSEYQFSVWVGSDEVDDDYAQFEVQFLDDGSPISEGVIDSGEFQPEDHTEPDQFVETTAAPENADEAVVRIILVNGGDFGLDRPLLWADDVRLQEFSDAPTAFDVEGVETGIEQTIAPDWTLFDDEFGEDEDDRGFDDSGEITHFGGGDLGGSVTDNVAGETAELAGGDLQVNADGSFSVTNPTQTGTFEFEYRLGYEGDHDDATVEIEIFDHELENPLCEEWDSNAQDQPIGWDGESISCQDLEDLPFTDTDHTAVGERSFTDNYINLDDEVHTEQTVYVVGGKTYTVSGLYGTDSEDYSGTIEFEYLDSDGHVIAAEGFTLGELQSESTTDFDRFTEITDAPDDAKRATLRLTVVRPSGHDDPAGVYFDDLSIDRGDPGEEPVNAYDVETEVGIYHTFDPSDTLFDDWGNGVDELGTPEAELVNFGGGDLSGSVTDHGPGESVPFAGGTLTVEADGSFSLEEPTDVGTHTFEYETENEHDSSTATVELWVRDSTLLDADCDPDSFEAWDDVSPGNGNIDCLDPQESGTGQPNGEQNPPVPPYAIGDRGGDGYDAVGEQTVPVRGGYTYELAGFVGTEATPEDSYVTLEVDYLNEDGTKITASGDDGADLSEMRSEGTTEFDAFSDTTVPPDEATHATVRIFVHSPEEMDLGGDAYARAYVDDLSFELLGTPPEANDVDLEVDAADTLTTSVVADHGHGVDDLGEPDADVASFGGGELAGDATEYDAEETADLAGGDLTIDADGSLELVDPSKSGTYQFDYRLENDAGYDDATVTIEVESLTVDGTVTDSIADGELGIAGATVRLDHEDGEESSETETASDGSYELEVGQRGDFELAVEASGYEMKSVPITLDEGDKTRDIGLIGNESVSGTVSDTTFETGLDGIDVAVGNGLGTYTAETDEDGEYTVENVPGTGEEYVVSVDQTGWDDNSTTVTIDDGDEVTGVDLAITGDARDAITLSDGETDAPLEGTTVRIEHETFGVAEDAFTTDGDGEMEIVLPGGFTYEYTFSHPGYEPAEIPLRSFDPGHKLGADYKLGGNAEITGTITDGETGEGTGGTTVTAQNGAGAYEATTSADGSYTVENVPGGHDYDVTIEADGYETVVESDEAVGDGTTHTLDSGLTGNAAIEGTVEDERTGDGAENADVTIVYPRDGEFTIENATDADGEFSIENVPGTDEEYTVVARAAGYDHGSVAVTVEDGVLADVGAIELAGNASVSGTIEDATFESGVPDVEVTVSDGHLEYTTTTDENGEYTVEGVPGTGVEYTVSTDPDGWDENSTTVTAGDGEEVQADLTVSGSRTATVEVHDQLLSDAGQSHLLGDATVTVEHDTGGIEPTLGETTVTTASDGSPVAIELPELPTHLDFDGKTDRFVLTAEKNGYESDTVYDEHGVSHSIQFSVSGTASVSGTVVDEATGEGIEDADVALEYPTGEEIVFEDATDADGAYAIEDVPGTDEVYTVHASADGYDSSATTTVVDDWEDIEDVTVGLNGTATVSGSVSDTTFETGLDGIDVAVENGLGTYTAETDENGEYTVESVPGTGDAYTVGVDPIGWDGESTTETISDGDDVTDVEFALTGDARDTVTLSDGETAAPLEGTTVSIEHETFGVAEDAFTADGDGAMEIVLPGGFTYEYTFSQPGYEPAEIPLRSFDPGHELSANYVLGGNAEITGQLTDSESGDGIEGATVTAENGAGAYDATTDENGEYTVEDVPGGHDYDVAIEASGYEIVVESDESVGEETTHAFDAELTGSATLGGTLTDETFGTALEDVEVDVAGEQEYVVETDEDGEYAATVAGTGEEYTVTVDPDGWVETSETVELGDGETVTDFDVTLGGDAAAEITLEDSETGGPIDGATVIAQNETLGESDSFVTAGDGIAEMTPLPGGFVYDVTIEANGYDGEVVTNVFLAAGSSESRTDALSGNATISGQVTDDAFGAPMESVTVTAENGAGAYEATTGGNGEYTIENVPGTGEVYTVTVDEAGYEPTAETVTVADGASVSRDLTVVGDAEITGTVTDLLTEDGIEDVTVTATNGAGAYETTTDEAGEYAVENLPGGETYDLVADRDGYGQMTRDGVALDAGTQQTENVVLEPIGETTVTGTVTDEVTDHPIAGANVTVELDDDRVDTGLAFETETNADGVYELTDVVGGYDYTLTIDADGYDVDTTSLHVDHDDEVDRSLTGDGALEFDVGGEQFGDGLEGATVEATPVDGHGTYAGSHTGNGTYTVPELASAVEYDVTITLAGYEPTEFDARVEEPGTTTLSEPALLDGDASLEVDATDSRTDEPLANVSVTIERENDGAQVEPVPTTDSDGVLAVTVPGTGDEYAVIANATGYDEATVTTDGVDTGATVPVSIALEGDSTIEGTVSDRVTGDAIEGVTVTVDADGSAFETTTAANGSYLLTAVPGEQAYEVTLEADGYRSESTVVTPSAETLVVSDSLWLAHDGDGTHEEPYRVTNAAELQAIGAEPDAHYVLEEHVDAAEADAWHGGDGFEPIGDDASPFTGSLDGQGNAISTLSVERPGNSSVGLFGTVDGGTIETLALENVSVTGDERVGGLVGSLSAGSIDGVVVSGSVAGEESVGGLVGSGGGVSASASSATVEGTTAVGGLVGESDGDVSGSFAVGQVTGTTATGGLVGEGTPHVDSSYWDATETTQNHSAGSPDSNGLNADELAGLAAQDTGLDFNETWIALDDAYPRHGWMLADLDLSLADDSLEPGATTDAIVTVDFFDGSTAYANETAALSSSDQDVIVIENATVEAVGDGIATLTVNIDVLESTLSVEVEPRSSSSGSSSAPADGEKTAGSGEISDDAGESGDSEASETDDVTAPADETGDDDGGEIGDDLGDGQHELPGDTDRSDDSVPGFSLHLTLSVVLALLLTLRLATVCE
ncbi:carboxypeptidase regulatory-like domain-containing protein [Natrarchaeobius chitinivorans]|uniref:carboxypeptidase regulatory-like domain-containing protein n=1 Tax=Natrarchaeobius chitinivorans TaxID=1679083 RepID=UPI000F520197|nr:carboxypeptidase regulatory-like domain-containing protein [Natrarchaeobius chitinivorans]